MPQPSKIPLAFAASGDKNVIPESAETTGLASWRDGFPAITSAPFSEGGIAPKRADFNGIFNALSLAILWQQQGGFYAYDATTDYEVGNIVLYGGDLYKCLSANGPSSAVKAPTDATVWAKVILTTATQSAAGYMSAEDKTALDNVPIPTTEDKIGKWQALVNYGGDTISIPSGGTWAYFIIYQASNGLISAVASVVAGGTVISPTQTQNRALGFGYRVA